MSKLEAQVLRLEQQIDEKNQSIYHNRNEAQNKIKHLKRNLFVSFCIFSLVNIHIFLGCFCTKSHFIIPCKSVFYYLL